MRLRSLVSLAVMAFLTMSAMPAFAACAFGCGGAGDAFAYGTQYLWPGQTVTWDTTAYLDKRAAGPDDGPFYAYLTEPRRRAQRVPRVDDGVQLAQVQTSARRDPYSFDASMTFTLPSTTAVGSYAVEVCDDPCTTRLGYMVPTMVEVVSDEIEARLNERIDQLSQRVRSLESSIKFRLRGAVKRSNKALKAEMAVAEGQLEDRISDLESKVTDLEKRLTSQDEPEDEEEISQSALAGGVAVLLLFGWLMRERARNRGRGSLWGW
ncbi:MAG TPA: hypothetical protein VFD47_03085 [Actinomycetota bacterium]|nr:hypothetical protein [Actinomycetota bacterium]